MQDNIYSTVPVGNLSKINPLSKKAVLDILKNNPGKFYHARRLAELSKLPTKGSQVELRKIITELVELEHHPIVSFVGAGYSYTPDSLDIRRNMIRKCIEALEHRDEGLHRRINAYRGML